VFDLSERRGLPNHAPEAVSTLALRVPNIGSGSASVKAERIESGGALTHRQVGIRDPP